MTKKRQTIPKRSSKDQPEHPRLRRIRELEKAGVNNRTPEESNELADLQVQAANARGVVPQILLANDGRSVVVKE